MEWCWHERMGTIIAQVRKRQCEYTVKRDRRYKMLKFCKGEQRYVTKMVSKTVVMI